MGQAYVMRKHLILHRSDISAFLPHWSRVTVLQQAWAQPLTSITTRDDNVWLSYADSCQGRFWNPADRSETALVFAAMAELHHGGLWVGEVSESVRVTARGEVVLTGLGSHWGVYDPWARHPSATGRPDLRLRWRQARDLTQTAQAIARHAGTAVREAAEIGLALGWSAEDFAYYFDGLRDRAA